MGRQVCLTIPSDEFILLEERLKSITLSIFFEKMHL